MTDDEGDEHEGVGLSPPEDIPAVSAERLVDGDLPVEDLGGTEPRRYPSTIGGAFYLVVLALGGVGLAVIGYGNWRTGVYWIAAGLGLAALTRVLLPSRDAGMLAVRARWLDVLILAATAAVLVYLAREIPPTFTPTFGAP